MTALSVAGLHAGYDPDLPIVKGVSFDITRGEAVSILGPNGAGKSTMIKAIAGLVPCFAGQVRLGQTDVTGLLLIIWCATAWASCPRPRTSSPG
jgi:branched-chain amino acid transport system ATP-binding protein